MRLPPSHVEDGAFFWTGADLLLISDYRQTFIVPGNRRREARRHQEPHPQLTLRGAAPAFSVRRRRHTDEVVESRRPSSYFVPIAAPKKKAKQGSLYPQDQKKDN